MKKAILFFALIAVSFVIFSQSDIKFGVFVDPKITWLASESRDASTEGLFFGFGGGLIIDRYFAKNYAFSTGISLGTQGGKLKYDDAITIQTTDNSDSLPAGTILKYKLQYITIPLGLKLKSNEIGYFSFFANVGLTPQINVKAKGESDNINGLENSILEDEINIFNLGYHFGGGIEYALSEDTSVMFGIQYQNGFLDVTKQSPKILSKVLSIQMGIIF